jgi:hypothetical protein
MVTKEVKLRFNQVNKVLGFRVSQFACLDDNGSIDSIDQVMNISVYL